MLLQPGSADRSTNMASSVARLKLIGDGDVSSRLIGKPGKKRAVKDDFADALFPVYSQSSAAPAIDYSQVPVWARDNPLAKKKLTKRMKAKNAVTKAIFLSSMADL